MRYDKWILLASLVLIVHKQIAVADEWKVSGTLDQEVEYNDNIALRTEPAAVFGYLLKPTVSANWNTPVMGVGITGRGDIRRYDDERWDCDNYLLRADQHYSLKRHIFSLSGGYSKNCSYSQQILDTGILIPNNQTERFNADPSWGWQLTPLDRLTLRPSYSETNYTRISVGDNQATNLNYQNNRTISINLSESHDWNRRLSTNAGLFYSDTEFSNVGSTSRQGMVGFQLGGQYVLTREWSVNAGGGLRWVQQPFSSSSAGDSGNNSLLMTQVGNLDLTYNGRYMNYSLSYSRSVNPSAYGQLLDYSSLGMKFSYQIIRELSFNVNGTLSENQAVGQAESQTAQNRKYYSASTGLIWKFAREWQLSATYLYRRQEYPDASFASSGTRDSNAVMFQLNYKWDGWKISR
ncbi:hypothetical protein [Methylomonas sp. MgM2]